jgi:hypothetical protein
MAKISKTKSASLMAVVFCFFYLAGLALAVDTDYLNAQKPNIKINIGGAINTEPFGDVVQTSCADAKGSTCIEIAWIGQYIEILYKYGIAIAAVLAVLMIMAGGLVWLISGGSPDKVGKGKEFIVSALTGLFLALFSFMILATVNPRLVNLEPISVIVPPTMSDTCCQEGQPKSGEQPVYSFQLAPEGKCENVAEGWQNAAEGKCQSCCVCNQTLQGDGATSGSFGPKIKDVFCYDNLSEASCDAQKLKINGEVTCKNIAQQNCQSISECKK